MKYLELFGAIWFDLLFMVLAAASWFFLPALIRWTFTQIF